MPNDNQNATMILTANSSITPGVSGGLTMLICNAVGPVLGFPIYVVGVVVSMLLSALIDTGASGYTKKFALFCLNALVIFSVAFGTNSVGRSVANSTVVQMSQIQSYFTLSAFAQNVPNPRARSTSANSLQGIINNSSISDAAKIKLIKNLNNSRSLKKNSSRRSSVPSTGFFKSWN